MVLSELVVIWLLIFLRFGTMLLLVPLFGATNVPNQIKILFTGIMATVFLTTGQYDVGIDPAALDVVLVACIFEIINGLVLGFVVVLIMNAIYIAGHLIDMDMGFAMVNVISAQDESEIPITANLFYLMMMILFVVSNAHHRIIEAFVQSMQIVPLGVLKFNPVHVHTFFELLKETFVIGFQIAFPVILTLLMANLILGMLSKAMPGMNVFEFGMPFKILIGLAVLTVVFPITIQMFQHILERMLTYWHQIIGFMR